MRACPQCTPEVWAPGVGSHTAVVLPEAANKSLAGTVSFELTAEARSQEDGGGQEPAVCPARLGIWSRTGAGSGWRWGRLVGLVVAVWQQGPGPGVGHAPPLGPPGQGHVGQQPVPHQRPLGTRADHGRCPTLAQDPDEPGRADRGPQVIRQPVFAGVRGGRRKCLLTPCWVSGVACTAVLGLDQASGVVSSEPPLPPAACPVGPRVGGRRGRAGAWTGRGPKPCVPAAQAWLQGLQPTHPASRLSEGALGSSLAAAPVHSALCLPAASWVPWPRQPPDTTWWGLVCAWTTGSQQGHAQATLRARGWVRSAPRPPASVWPGPLHPPHPHHPLCNCLPGACWLEIGGLRQGCWLRQG